MSAAPSGTWPAILTWRAPDASQMESVRIQLSGNRIRANGRIVAAATDEHVAFGVYYDLQTDESGATKRLGLTVTVAERERQLVVARDEENMWLVTDARGQSRAGYDGALDVDMVFSPFFNTLPIRRARLHQRAAQVTLPTIYLGLPEMTVTAAEASYGSTGPGEGITVRTPGTDPAGVTLAVDADGFVIDYPGLAARI
ncbi:putative glycolipid-binding domain-containing protein [[Mycobacterium] crassicus]